MKHQAFKRSLIIAILSGTLLAMGTHEWNNSIQNPVNQPYVLEVAFNLGIPASEVTQEQFNLRYPMP